ncbi:hypothetical protein DVY91_05455 [Enterococcus faecalis]|nr:hypothetical protein [Enterococcus faecalis]EGO8371200.1 hypothetical protein [Enterococcus faecalis]EGO8404555.1 hypothetical protein [Enterococcus faecalis]EGO8409154.1 hypothetical protein [Enterococcus faecalis]EGO8433322.1 hypothetical protein [Enterococcus faecalis]
MSRPLFYDNESRFHLGVFTFFFKTEKVRSIM